MSFEIIIIYVTNSCCVAWDTTQGSTCSVQNGHDILPCPTGGSSVKPFLRRLQHPRSLHRVKITVPSGESASLVNFIMFTSPVSRVSCKLQRERHIFRLDCRLFQLLPDWAGCSRWPLKVLCQSKSAEDESKCNWCLAKSRQPGNAVEISQRIQYFVSCIACDCLPPHSVCDCVLSSVWDSNSLQY